jgi:hypothetical protein
MRSKLQRRLSLKPESDCAYPLWKTESAKLMYLATKGRR